MASFKFLKSLSSKYIYMGHLKIFPLYLITCRVVEVLTIYKFLAYITQKNSINYKNISILIAM